MSMLLAGIVSLIFVAAALLVWSEIARAMQTYTVVVPNACETQPGNWGDDWPFNFPHDRGQRYQQVYNANQFPQYSIIITELRLRPDEIEGRAFDAVIPDIGVTASTTPWRMDELSQVFMVNLGKDMRTVRKHGPLHLSSTAAGNPDRDFPIIIPLHHTFIYDPMRGNLLLDIWNYSGGVTTQMDSHAVGGGVAARIWGFYESISHPVAHSVQADRGLVMQLVYRKATWINRILYGLRGK